MCAMVSRGRRPDRDLDRDLGVDRGIDRGGHELDVRDGLLGNARLWH